MKLRQFHYDLHVHSCLSPCADTAMTPATIAGLARLNGLDIVALTDHNSCQNCPAFLEACAAYGILGIPGMELTVAEDFHCVLLFPSLSEALRFEAALEPHRMKLLNRNDIYGHQYVMDADDRILADYPQLLLPATALSFSHLSELVADYGGLMFPAHIDKDADSLLAVLGAIPPDSRFCAAELKDLSKLHSLRRAHPYLTQCRILSNSDAHYMQDLRDASTPECPVMPLPECSLRAVWQYLSTRP